MTTDSVHPAERWTAKRRVEQVGSILKGETSVAEAAGKHGLTLAEVEDWGEKFLMRGENAPRSRPRDENALKGRADQKLNQKIDDLVLSNDNKREALLPVPDQKTRK